MDRCSKEPAWLLWFDDPSVESEVFTGEGAEEAAKTIYESARQHWSCTLFKEVMDE
jgi:hypothetical protein